MIVLDTNVVSEPVKLRPNSVVREWLNGQRRSDLFLPAPGLAELMAGAATMPEGRRRTLLEQGIHDLVEVQLQHRVLPFDEAAAVAYSELVAKTRAIGRPMSTLDCQIAAIAVTKGFAVATRDTAPFVAAGVPVIDPWAAAHDP